MSRSPFLLLMPSYNQAHFMVETVQSVLAQTDPNWELWILDNSSDETPGIMATYSDPRIHFIHEPERCDPGTCLNRMLEMAQGDYFSYIHTDNPLKPEYVRKLRAAMHGHPMAVAYCNFRVVDADGRPVVSANRPELDWERLFTLRTYAAPFAAGTALAKAIGGFQPRHLADDLIFLIRAWGHGPWRLVPDVLLDYRLHNSSRTEEGGKSMERVHLQTLVSEAQRVESEGGSLPDWSLRIAEWMKAAEALEAQVAPICTEAAQCLQHVSQEWVLCASDAPRAYLLAHHPFRMGLGDPETRLGLTEPSDLSAENAVAVAFRRGRRQKVEKFDQSGTEVWSPKRSFLNFGFRGRWHKAMKTLDDCGPHRDRVLLAVACQYPIHPRRWAILGCGLGSFCLAAWARTWWQTEPIGWVETEESEKSFMGWPVLQSLPPDWDEAKDILLGKVSDRP